MVPFLGVIFLVILGGTWFILREKKALVLVKTWNCLKKKRERKKKIKPIWIYSSRIDMLA